MGPQAWTAYPIRKGERGGGHTHQPDIVIMVMMMIMGELWWYSDQKNHGGR